MTRTSWKTMLVAALFAVIGVFLAGFGLFLYWRGNTVLVTISDANTRVIAEYMVAGRTFFLSFGFTALMIAFVIAKFGPATTQSEEASD